MKKLTLAAPDITDRERELVLQVLRTPTLSGGPMIQRFETMAAACAGRAYAVAVNSGTSALHLIIRGLGLGRGDAVITTPFSFIATAVWRYRIPRMDVDWDIHLFRMCPEGFKLR